MSLPIPDTYTDEKARRDEHVSEQGSGAGEVVWEYMFWRASEDGQLMRFMAASGTTRKQPRSIISRAARRCIWCWRCEAGSSKTWPR